MHIGVPTSDRSARAGPPGFLKRVKAWFADFFDPTLACDACGFEDKQRHFARTGVAHEYSTGTGRLRSTASEIEFRCPECGETQYTQEIRTYYPLF